MTTRLPRRPADRSRRLAGLSGCAAILAVAVASAPAPAAAQSGGNGPACSQIIESLPTTITEPGVYCLQTDFWYEDGASAVTIQSPGVTLDCRGFAIDGTPLPDNTGTLGVYAYAEAKGLVVRNCYLRGFLFGVIAYGGGLIEDNLIRGPGAEGIYVEGDGAIVRRNRIVDLGNSESGFQWAWGIVTFGDIDIIDNDIDGLIATPGGGQGVIGIVANDGYEPTQTYVIKGNRIRGLQPDAGQSAYGISSGSTGQLVIRDNVFFGDDLPNSIGLYCYNAPDSHVAGNDIYDFPMATLSCTPDADNVIHD